MTTIVSRMLERTISRGKPSYKKQDLASFLLPDPTNFSTFGANNRIVQGLWGTWVPNYKLSATDFFGTNHMRSPLTMSRAGFVVGCQQRYTRFNTDLAALFNTSRQPDKLFFGKCSFITSTQQRNDPPTGNNEILQSLSFNIFNGCSYVSAIFVKMPTPILHRMANIDLTNKSIYTVSRVSNFIFAADGQTAGSTFYRVSYFSSGPPSFQSNGAQGEALRGDMFKYSGVFSMRNRVASSGFLHYRGNNWNRDYQASQYIKKTGLMKNATVR